MDLRDIMAEPTGIKRPEHPDFWLISEVILGLKASLETGSLEAQERSWRATYEAFGDFDSIAYAAVQCAFDLYNIHDGKDWMNMVEAGLQDHYIRAVQAFFDGFAVGANFGKRKADVGGQQEDGA